MTIEQIVKISHEVPEKYTIKELEKCIAMHKEYNTEDSRLKMLTYCMLLISSDMCRKFGVDKTITELRNLKSLDDRLNSFKN